MTIAAVTEIHAAATLALAGLIWFVQIVHYPLMAWIDERVAVRYARRHQTLTSYVVAPLMSTEAVTAVWLLVVHPMSLVTLTGVLLLMVIWLSTGLLQVPCHRRLALVHDVEAVRSLVRGNWIRTLSWSGRAWIAIALLQDGASTSP